MATVEDINKLYGRYLQDKPQFGPGGVTPCECEFHSGRWSSYKGKTHSGLEIDPDNPCTATNKRTQEAVNKAVYYAKTDYNCYVCGERNEYAAANFGSKYKCYKCRT